MATYSYAVLSCASNATDESLIPFLALVKKLSAENPEIEIFVAKGWQANTPKEHRQYFVSITAHVSSFSADEVDEFLNVLRELSIGPLRFQCEGKCRDRMELSHRLSDTFGQLGYDVLNTISKCLVLPGETQV